MKTEFDVCDQLKDVLDFVINHKQQVVVARGRREAVVMVSMNAWNASTIPGTCCPVPELVNAWGRVVAFRSCGQSRVTVNSGNGRWPDGHKYRVLPEVGIRRR